MLDFKGDTIVAWLLLVEMKHTEINGCALTGDCRLLICVKPGPSKAISLRWRGNTKNLFPLWRSKKCMTVKYLFRNWKTFCTVGLFAERIQWQGFERETVGTSVRGQRWKCWALWGKQKIRFQPQYAQCFTATSSLPQTYDYNLQYQNASTVSNIPNWRTVISPTVSDALSNQSSVFLDICWTKL